MKKNVIKTFSTVFIITLVTKVLGLLRDIVFAKYYGTGYVATAFFASIRIPTQLLDIGLGSAIASTFIPVFNEIFEKDSKEKANSFANNFINIIAVISTVISVIGIVFAPQIVNMLAGGFDAKTFQLTVELVRITFPMIIFTAIAFSFVGFLQSYGEFNIPAMISAVSNLGIIIFLVFFRERFGIHGVATFMLIAWALQVIIQIPFAIKNGYKFSPKISIKDESIKKVFKLALPIMFSSSVIPISNLIATRIASGLGESAVASLEYAYKLYIVIVGVFTYAIGNILFPELAKLNANDEKEKYVSLIKSGISVIMYLLIPITLGIVIYREGIISVIYQRGEFTASSTLVTSGALLFYSLGMIGFGIVEVLNKSFYAKQKVRTPLIVGIIVILFNIVLTILLSKVLQTSGVALAMALTSTLNGLILLICLNRENKGIISKEMFVKGLKILISALIMFIVVSSVNVVFENVFESTTIIKVIEILIGAGVGVITYYLASLTLDIEEANIFKKYVVDKFSKNN